MKSQIDLAFNALWKNLRLGGKIQLVTPSSWECRGPESNRYEVTLAGFEVTPHMFYALLATHQFCSLKIYFY